MDGVQTKPPVPLDPANRRRCRSLVQACDSFPRCHDTTMFNKMTDAAGAGKK
ncbi:unnamed protein product [Pleuronectes platessa]|uniref:Uncharacterized protein n=1 Tax=Pleuronectes platessa TaxID=8262 RepID=A0A9N7U2M6_PLEPL|nr:unnamed protein product [Pleuronectes platessa]